MSKERKGVFRWAAGLGILVMAGVALLVLTPRSFGDAAQKYEAAPLNPEFVKYLADRAAGVRMMTATPDGRPLGMIPSPLDLSQVNVVADRVSDKALPALYDLRSKNKLTSVKDQGNCGSCWSFGTYASLESYLKPGKNMDFSEQDLIGRAGFDLGECDGGNIYMSAAYLTRWDGPLLESQKPYEYLTPLGLAPAYHVQNIVMMPGRKSATDNAAIKNAVMKNGAAYVSFYWSGSSSGSEFYRAANAAYYYNRSYQSGGGGHAVAIVGWDDNFSKSKFAKTPSGNGAFICKNSWGKGWGKSGYFYVSYYDNYFAKSNTAWVKGEPVANYKTNYSYDDLGWITNVGTGKSNSCWMANIFTAKTAGALKSVGFYTSSALKNSYEIYIYTNAQANKPKSGTLKKTKKGSITGAGYYTIPLGTNVPLVKNKRFSVVVKLTTKGYNYPIPIERNLTNWSSRAKAGSGESYVSPDGKDWDELKSCSSSWCNNCLKAYAK